MSPGEGAGGRARGSRDEDEGDQEGAGMRGCEDQHRVQGFGGPAPEFGGVCEFEDRFLKPGGNGVVGQLFSGELVVAEDITGMWSWKRREIGKAHS